MLQPRKFRYNVFQKKRQITDFKQKRLVFGSVGVKFLSSFILSSNFLFRMNMFIKKSTKRSEKTLRRFWCSVFPNQPLTKKPQGSRMGKGKGKRITWGALIKKGFFLYELKNLRLGRAYFYLNQFRLKIPAQISLISKSNFFFFRSIALYRFI